jgi:uncharacterized protein
MDRIGAIDAWATLVTPEGAKRWPPEFVHIFERYKVDRRMLEGMTLDTMLAEMDAADVEMAVLSAFGYRDLHVLSNDAVARIVAERPDRFIGAGTVDPRRRPMEVAREVERMVRDLGLRLVRLEPYAYGGDDYTGLPPTDKRYWPVYLKCVELGVPVAIQVGHTGPLLPSECGRPIYLDEVALAFPELVIFGCHLGQPWHEEMMTLAWKHPNVYVETSARPAKFWPPEFLAFVKGWGQDKVIWATDYPLVSFERGRDDIDALGLPLPIQKKLLRDNFLRAAKLRR